MACLFLIQFCELNYTLSSQLALAICEISIFHFPSVIMDKGDRYDESVGRLRIFLFSSLANKFDRQ